MSRFTRACAITLTFVLTLSLALRGQSSAALRFHEALILERADGRVADAIFRYERILEQFPKDGEVTPRVLDRLARLYDNRNDSRAVTMLTRLVTEYPMADPYAADARARLAALQASDSRFAMRTPLMFLDSVLNVAPNGKWAVRGRPPQNGAAIRVLVDLATGTERPIEAITGRFLAGGPAGVVWSPDSRWLAVSVGPIGGPDPAVGGRGAAMEQSALGELQVIALDSLKATTLCPSGRALSWSPDSKQLAVYAGTANRTSEIRVVTIATGASRTLAATTAFPNSNAPGDTDGGGVAWSPDGKRLVYRVIRDQQADEIRICTVATGESRRLVVSGVPSGWRVKIASNIERLVTGWTTKDDIVVREIDPAGGSADIMLVPLNGGQPKRVCSTRPSGNEVCRGLTPDGALSIVGTQDSHRYMVREIATGKEHPVTLSSGTEWWAQVSPDGKMMTLISNREGGGKWGLYVAPIGSEPVANPVRLTSLEALPSFVRTYQWTTDGSFLAGFVFNTSNIYRVSMDAATGRSVGPMERLTHDVSENDNPHVSPDGKLIVYRQHTFLGSSIGVMNAFGINERPVRSVAGTSLMAFYSLFWRSPSDLVFDTEATPTQSNPGPLRTPVLATLNVETGVVAALAHADIGGSYFAWQFSRARNEIVYLRAPAIMVHSLQDGSDRTLTSAEGKDIHGYAVSADGQHVVLLTTPRTGRGAGEIRFVTIEGSIEKTLEVPATVRGPLSWSPDRRFLVYSQPDGVPMVLSVDSAASWPLAETANAIKLSSAPSWAPDGSFLVLSLAGTRQESRVWEGVTGEAVRRITGNR